MLNSIILVGRAVRDAEMRYTPSGIPTASFPLAVDRPFKNAQGQKETDFLDIVTWRKTAEFVGQYVTKGRLCAVQGRLQVRSYDTPEGQKRKVYEIIADHVSLLDRRPETAGGAENMGTEVDEGDLPFSDGDAA